jgi:hypothetical protein
MLNPWLASVFDPATHEPESPTATIAALTAGALTQATPRETNAAPAIAIENFDIVVIIFIAPKK